VQTAARTASVPILRLLAPIIAAWKLRAGGEGPLVHANVPTRGGWAGRPPSFMRSSALTGYQATRHTFASQWVLAGGSIDKLKEIMGHSLVQLMAKAAESGALAYAVVTDTESIVRGWPATV